MAMDFRMQKELVVVVSVVALTVLEFFTAALVLPAPGLTGPALVLLALSVVWTLVMALALGIVRRWGSVLALILTPAISVVLAGRFSPGAMVGGALLIISLLLARRFTAGEINNRITYKTSDVFFSGLKLILLGLILSLAGLTLPILEESLSQGRFVLTAEQVGYATGPFRPLLEGMSPGLTPDTSVDQLIDQRVTEELPEGVELTPEQREQIHQQVSTQFGTPVAGEDTLNEVVAARVNDWLTSFTVTSPIIFALVIILIVVLAVRAFVPLIAWVLLPLLALLVWLSRKSSLLRLTERTATVEQLSF